MKMIGIMGHFEYRLEMYDLHVMKNLVRFWSYTLKAYGIKKLIFIDIDRMFEPNQGLITRDRQMPLEIYSTLKDAMEAYPDVTYVFLEPVPHSISLPEFQHPADNVIYVFGSNYGGLPPADLRDKGTFVHIPVKHKEVPLWAHMALGMVLYDRYNKGE